jgi:chloramphenicol 3-O phosphotransferase
MHVRGGRILVLNGTSSAGKTTLANALQKALPDQYELVGLDLTLWSLPPELVVVTDDVGHAPVEGWLVPIRDGVQIALPTAGPRALELLEIMYATFAARADAGENLIVDDVLWHPHAHAMAVAHFAERDAWLVEVYCPIDVAVEHEKQRSDRALGGAALFFEPVYRHGIYDIRVDTSLLTPEEAAQQVISALSAGGSPTAFRKLRSRTAG